MFFSLIQTSRHLKINPQEYIENVMRRIMGPIYNHLKERLPHQGYLALQTDRLQNPPLNLFSKR